MDFNVGITEAESIFREGYGVYERDDLSGGKGVQVFLRGRLEGDFEGPTGRYSVTIHYLDESDGVGEYFLLVNDQVVHTWLGDGGGNGFGTPETETVILDLATDDVIGTFFEKKDGEHGRLDFFNIVPVGGGDTGGGDTGGSTGTIGLGLTEAESLEVGGGYIVETNAAAANNRVVATTTTGSVSGEFDGAAGTYDVTVNYLDESDGVGTYQLSVNGVQVGVWQGTGGSSPTGSLASQTFSVALSPGDVVQVTGVSSAGELARLDSILIGSGSDTGGGDDGGSTGGGAGFGVGRTEAETLDLAGGYEVQSIAGTSGGQVIGTLSNGSGSGTFNGGDGNYDITVNYLDESDGVGTFRLLVNGVAVDTWQGTGGNSASGTPAQREINVNLNNGDTISLEGVRATGEAARFDSVDIAVGAGGGGAATIGVGLTEVEDLNLSGAFDVEVRAGVSGGELVGSPTGTYLASGTFAAESGSYSVDVDWFNENDGVATFELLVNGVVRSTWQGFGGTGAITAETETIELALNQGDTVAIRGTKGDGERARVDSIQITPSEGGTGNAAPTVAVPVADQSAEVDAAFSLSVPISTFSDADGDALTLDATLVGGGDLPAWLDFNAATGVFSGTPAESDAGTLSIALTASDGEAGVTDVFNIFVQTDPGPVTGAVIGVGVTEAEALDLDNYEVEQRSDASGGGSVRTFGAGIAAGTFTGASGVYDLDIDYFNESDGVATWSVEVNGAVVGTFAGIGGTSALGTIATETIPVTLNTGDQIRILGEAGNGELARIDKLTISASGSSNTPPIVANEIADATGTVGSALSIVIPGPTFSDADGDALTLTATLANGAPLPSWLTFDPAAGTFSGTPGAGDIGTLDLRVTANDGEATVSDTFELAISGPPGGGAILTPGATEAEVLDLVGYEVETRSDALGGQSIRTFDSGSATGTFNGPSGRYQLDIAFLNESDGEATWTVFVNDVAAGSFTGTGGTSGFGTRDSETFELLLQDGDVISVTGVRGGDELARLDRLTLTSLEVNEFPTAVDDTAATDEETGVTFDVLGNDTDAEDDALSVTAINGQTVSAGGVVNVDGALVAVNGDGTLTVTPAPDFVGDFVFTYTVSDGAGFDVGIATVTVANTNDAPTVATALGTVSVDEDTPVSIALAGSFSDIDPGDTLALSATLANGDPLPDWLTFDDTPGAEALSGTPLGTDTGTYTIDVTATDGDGETATSTLTLAVAVVNDAPIAVDDTFSGDEDAPVTIDLLANDTDEEGDPLFLTEINGAPVSAGDILTIQSSVDVDGAPVAVSVSVLVNSDGTVTVTPPADFSGPVAFQYTVSDDEFTDTATATINFASGNDAPTVTSAIVDQVASEDTPFSYEVPAGLFDDLDGDSLVLSAFLETGQPLPSWLSFSDGVFSGTPGATDAGPLRIMVLASDGQFVAGSIFGLDVQVVDDGPVASDVLTGAFAVDEGFSLVIGDVEAPISDFGTDEDSVLTPASVTFTGATLDGVALSGVAEIGLSYDGETGQLDINTAGLALFEGLGPTDTAELVVGFEVSDGTSSDTGTYTFTVTGVDDAPVVSDDVVTMNEGTQATVDVLANDTDPEGEALSVSRIDGQTVVAGDTIQIENGSVRLNQNATLTITPDTDFDGTLSFGYTADDGALATDGTVTVTVNGVNDAPTATPVDLGTISAGTPFGETLVIDDFGSDPDTTLDAASLSFINASIDGGAALAPLAIGLSYDPNTGALAIDPSSVASFVALAAGETAPVAVTFDLSDGEFTASDTLSFLIEGVNDGPVIGAIADQTVPEDDMTGALQTAIQSTLAAISDPEDDAVTVSMVFVYPPESGLASETVAVAGDGSFTYVPPADFSGDVTVTVTADDGSGSANGSSSTGFTLKVSNDPDAPVATDDSATTDEDTPVTLDVRLNDSDNDGDPLSVTEIDGQAIAEGGSVTVGNASVSLLVGGALEVTPGADDESDIVFDYTVSDGALNDTGSVTIDVTPVNDAPVAQDFAVEGRVTADAPVTLTLGADFQVSDLVVDPDSTFGPADFTVFGSSVGVSFDQGSGELTFDPSAVATLQALTEGQTTTTSAAFVVVDGVTSDIGLISFTVEGVNDAPTVVSGIADQTVDAGLPLIVADATSAFADVDQGDVLTFSAADGNGDPLPSWITIDPVTGLVSGTPTVDDIGTITIDLTATDGGDLSVTDTFDVTVTGAAVSMGRSISEDQGREAPVLEQSLQSDGGFDFDGIVSRAVPAAPQAPLGVIEAEVSTNGPTARHPVSDDVFASDWTIEYDDPFDQNLAIEIY